MTDYTLYPSGTVSNPGAWGWVGASTLHETVDDWATGPLDTANYMYQNVTGNGTFDVFFNLDWPAEFGGADSSTTYEVRVHYRTGDSAHDHDVFTLYAHIVSGDEGGAETVYAGDEGTGYVYQVSSQTALNTVTVTDGGVNAAGEALTAAQWQSSVLRIRHTRAVNMGTDSPSHSTVYAIEVTLRNAITLAPTPPTASVEISSYPPLWVAYEYLPFSVVATPDTARVEMVSHLPRFVPPSFSAVVPTGNLVVNPYKPAVQPVTVGTSAVQLTSYAPLFLPIGFQAVVPTASIAVASREAYFDSIHENSGIYDRPRHVGSSSALGSAWNLCWTIPVPVLHPDSPSESTLWFCMGAGAANTSSGGYARSDRYFYPLNSSPSAGSSDPVIESYTFWPSLDSAGDTSTGARTVFADFGSDGGQGVDPWIIFTWRHWDDNYPNSVQTHTTFLARAAGGSTETVYMGDGSIPVYGTGRTWHHLFYGRDVLNDTGYLIATRVTGSNTVPVIFKWQGGESWDAGTDILASGDETGTFTTKIIGWCRADQANPDRIYVVVTTNVSSSIRVKVIAVDLTNIAGYTVVVNDTTNYDGSLWGTWDVEDTDSINMPEPCWPIERSNGDKYYYLHTIDSGGVQNYTRLFLNDSNWLAPSIDQQPRGGNNLDSQTGPSLSVNDPVLAGLTDTAEHTYHGIVWHRGYDTVFAIQVRTTVASDTDTFYGFFSWKNLDTTGSTWSDWKCVDITEFNITYTQYYSNAAGGVRGWGQNHLGEPSPFWTVQGVHSQNGGVGPINVSQYVWWEPSRLDMDDTSSVVISPAGTFTAAPGVIYQPSVGIAPVKVAAVPTYKSAITFSGRYDLLPITAQVDAAATIKPSNVLVYDDTDPNKVAICKIKAAAVTVSAEIATDLAARPLNVHSPFWAQSWTDDLIALVNVKRAGVGLPPVAAIDNVDMQRYVSNQKGFDVPQRHAQDMADNDSYVFDDTVNFTPGYQTTQERFTKMDPISLVVWIDWVDVTDGMGEIVRDSNFPSADHCWNTVGWHNSTIWEYDFDAALSDPPGTNTELYLQVGMAVGYRTGSAEPQSVYFSIALTNYTGHPYTGGSGGGNFITTPVGGVRPFGVYYWHSGVSWAEHVIALINEERERLGIAPYLVPDAAFYARYKPDIARLHSVNMADSRYLNHNDVDGLYYPVGQRLVTERAALAGFKNAAENIVYGSVSAYLDPLDSSRTTPNLDVLSDYTILTPPEAFSLWYHSAGHYQNMVFDWGDREVYALIGWEFRRYPPGTVITDGYHNLVYPNRYGWIQFITNNFVDASTEVAYRVFNTNYQIDGAVIEVLHQTWDLHAYVDVKTEQSLPYAIRVASDHGLLWGARIAKAHTIPTLYSLSSAHSVSYSYTARVESDQTITYAIAQGNYIAADHGITYAGRVQRGHEVSYGAALQLIAAHRLFYTEYDRVSADHSLEYSLASSVAADHIISYSATSNVASDHAIDYSITAVEKVTRSYSMMYTIIGGVIVDTTPLVTLKTPLR